MLNVLSICHGMGLLDRAFLDNGFLIQPGCEIDPRMRKMYEILCGGSCICYDLKDLPSFNLKADGIIGGPPCQSNSKLRAIKVPKFPDLTPLVIKLIDQVQPSWYLFENVGPLDIPGACHIKLDAMHFGKPHQSRPRWFTYSPNLKPPKPLYHGTVDDLMAYSIVVGRQYGPKRGAILQGFPDASKLPVKCSDLQLGLANAVHYGLACAWAQSIKQIK